MFILLVALESPLFFWVCIRLFVLFVNNGYLTYHKELSHGKIFVHYAKLSIVLQYDLSVIADVLNISDVFYSLVYEGEVSTMKRIVRVLLPVLAIIFAAGLTAPHSVAAEITTEQAVNYQNLSNGVAVMDDGIVYAVAGSSIKGFNSEGANVFTASLTAPAKPGNLCSYGEYLFAAGYMSGHMNEIYDVGVKSPVIY